MADDQNATQSFDAETADKLAREVFTPALQRAVKEARESGCGSLELLHGAANAYQHLMVSLLGESAAASLMRDHAQHLTELAAKATDRQGDPSE